MIKSRFGIFNVFFFSTKCQSKRLIFSHLDIMSVRLLRGAIQPTVDENQTDFPQFQVDGMFTYHSVRISWSP